MYFRMCSIFITKITNRTKGRLGRIIYAIYNIIFKEEKNKEIHNDVWQFLDNIIEYFDGSKNVPGS